MNTENKLHELAAAANHEESNNVLDSVLGMVSTLIKDGRLDELNDVFMDSFPEYYIEGPETITKK